MSLTVTFQGRKFQTSFDSEYTRLGDEWADAVTLRQLIDQLSQQSRVPAENIKLLSSGVVMLDMDAPLSFYGLGTGSKVMMLVDKRPKQNWGPSTTTTSPRIPPPTHPVLPKEPELPREERLFKLLNDQIEYTQTIIQPLFGAYKKHADDFLLHDKSSSNTLTPKQLHDEYARISESLLQCLLKIDGVECESNETELRAKRREAVRLIQGQLDILDGLKEQVVAHSKNLSSL
ncbi:hypothetical protein RTP6_001852 [Batrachochytrium dendrobatidis]